MTSPVTTFPELNKQVTRLLSKQGVTNYKGLNQAANLCETTDRCARLLPDSQLSACRLTITRNAPQYYCDTPCLATMLGRCRLF
jgi:hypothetical protein